MRYTVEKIEALWQELEATESGYLQERGWEHSCDFPDEVWRWSKMLSTGRFVTKSRTEALRIQKELDA